MRWVLAVVLSLPGAARAFAVDAELAGGIASNEGPFAPMLSGRVGVDLFGFLAPGLRVSGVLGPEGLDTVGDGSPLDPSGNRAWSALVELRLHTPGRLQAFFDVAGGVGRVVRFQGHVHEAPARVGVTSAAYQFALGFRGYVSPRVALGLSLAVPIWTGTAPAPTPNPNPIGGVPSGTMTWELALCGSIATTFGW